jgi:hypothetical protein
MPLKILWRKNWRFCSNYVLLVFEKKLILNRRKLAKIAGKWQKSTKIVVITSTPGVHSSSSFVGQQ